MDLNKVMIIGRLTRDPEVRTLQSGQSVATFSVATSRQWTDQNTKEKRSQTEFHNVVAWRRLAEICAQYLKKGSQVYIEGYLQTRSWDDPSGQKRYRTEIVTDNMIMLGGRGDGAGNTGGGNTGNGFGGGNASGGYSAQRDTSVPPAPQPSGPEEETISIEDIPF